MKSLIRIILQLVLVAGFALIAASCGSQQAPPVPNQPQTTTAPPQPEAQPPSVFTYISIVDPMLSWDPAESWAAEIRVLFNVYETLVRIDSDGKTFKPQLAERWEMSDDGLTWTFYLRQGVKFHSGKVLTAQMAVDSIKRTLEMDKTSTYIWNGVEEITALDEKKIEFKLSRPLPMLYIVSAGYSAYIYNPEYTTDWYNQGNMDGTGPYTLKSYTKNSEVVLEKFPDYWGGWKPGQFDYAIVKVVTEPATRRQMLVNGEGDLIEQIPLEYISQLEKEPTVAISNEVSYQVLVAFLNTQKPPLDNKQVRQALAYLTPYDDIVDHVLGGYGVQARGILPPSLWGYGENVFQYQYDLDKAKTLLAEAGYPNGGFTLSYVYSSGDKNLQKVGELMKDSFAKAGITLELKAMTADAKYSLARGGEPKDRQDIVTLYWWPDNVDPSGYFYSMLYTEKTPGFNLAYYYDEKLDAMIDDANSLAGTSIEQATAKYQETQNYIMEQSPILSIYCDNYVRPYLKSVKGYVDNPAYSTVVFFYELTRE